jgi:predicted dehydrogenase
MNSQESSELVRRAEKANVLTAVNYNVRFYPLCIEAAKRVQNGDVGDIFHISGSYVQDWLHQPTDFNWRVLSGEGGALRAMADIGTHWLDLIQCISGLDVHSVCADLQTVYPVRQRPAGGVETFSGKLTQASQELIDVAIDTEDFGSVLIRFQSGARGVMHVSQVTAGQKNCIRFEIAGSKQSLAWDSQRPNEMWVGNRNEPNQTLLRDPALLSSPAKQHAQYPGGHNEGFPDTFKQLFRSFYSAIEGRGVSGQDWSAYPTFADGHREIVLCEAILKSARERKWIEL